MYSEKATGTTKVGNVAVHVAVPLSARAVTVAWRLVTPKPNWVVPLGQRLLLQIGKGGCMSDINVYISLPLKMPPGPQRYTRQHDNPCSTCVAPKSAYACMHIPEECSSSCGV